MKISEKLYQFTDNHTFLVVAGMHAGALYYAHEGEVKKLEGFEIPIPKYSDREGFYARGGKGGTYVSGAVREVNKEDIQKQFLKEIAVRLNKEVAAIAKSGSIGIYLYAPREILPHLEKGLDVKLRRSIHDRFQGNHLHAQPPELIGMLNKKRLEGAESLKKALAKPEAKKLLRKRR